MARSGRRNYYYPSMLTRRQHERVVNRAIDAGVALGTIYVGAGILGAVAGAFRR